jgi:hypothetical protein
MPDNALLMSAIASCSGERKGPNGSRFMKERIKEIEMSQVKQTTQAFSPLSASRVGFYSAVLTTIVAIVTFGLAMTAIPISGANCPADCVDYPYLDTVAQYPKDFLWMPPAMLLVLVYVALMVSIHSYVGRQGKVFSQIGLSFALIAAAILLSDYYLQFSVVPVSLMNAETEGVAMFIQYNPHGVFLVLEELGYLVMGLSFLFVGLGLSNRSRLESVICWIFFIGFVLAMLSLVVISMSYGLERLDRLEVLVISIDWLILIVNGVLLSIMFGRQQRAIEYS